MDELIIAAAICSVPTVLGRTLDKLLLNRSKTSIHKFLIRQWCLLDELTVINYFERISGTILAFYNYMGRYRDSSTIILGISIMSFGLTLVSFIFGIALESKYSYVLDSYNAYHIFTILISNVLFNTLSFAITLRILWKINYHKSSTKLIPFVLLDVFLAYQLSVLSIVLVSIMNDENNLLELWKEALSLHYDVIFLNQYKHMVEFCYSIAAFVPTFLILLIFLIFWSAKISLRIFKSSAKYLIESVTEIENDKNLKVFTLTGLFFSVIFVILSAIIKILKA